MGLMKKVAVALAVAAGAVASPALAQDISFKIGSVGFRMPQPETYCPPQRQADVDRMATAARLDTDNLTLLSLVQCSAEGDALSYILVKAPKDSVNSAMTLSELMTLAGSSFDNSADLPLDSTEQAVGQALAGPGSAPAAVSMAIGPRGRDEACLYIGGVARSEVIDGGALAIGGCITVVGGRMLHVTFYARGGDPNTVRLLMKRARTLALSVQARR